jgi:hypothetical protein
MRLLRKRPSMDPSDSEQQALARLCLSNDSDRIIERMLCMLPVQDVGSTSWIGAADAFGANLWDIEPLCQVAGICNDEAIIIDSSHAASIVWDRVPRIHFKSFKSRAQRLLLAFIASTVIWNPLFSFAVVWVIIVYVTALFIPFPSGPEPPIMRGMRQYARLTPWPCLVVGFFAPFCMWYIFNGAVQEVQPWLIGFEGTMPIEKLESIVFGNHAERLEYTASSGLLCSRDNLTRRGIAPVIEPEAIPAGHSIFTLIDTVSHLRSIQDCAC